ncbi:MAG: hypothetical protein K0S74_1076 [Chlamydiales bacterium]|jgi:hypothetical protein|nr:hypothetical protein [Chlamydiales bacterium]
MSKSHYPSIPLTQGRRAYRPYYEELLPIKRSSWLFPWIEILFIKSWWMILFIISAFCLFESSMAEKRIEQTKLSQQLATLQQKLYDVKELQADYQAQIASQNDHEWIELTLLKELGLVPEGYTKIYFENDKLKS